MQQLLVQSDEMCSAFAAVLAGQPLKESRRNAVALSLSSLAMEHGFGLRHLIEAGAPSSALALFRCQFEVTARAAWVAFAAPDAWIGEFTKPVLDLAEPTRSPSMDDMLKDLKRSAPQRLAMELDTLKSAAWKPLHSYVHGGVRPVAESLRGYDEAFLAKTILYSNGLSAMGAMLAAGLLLDEHRMVDILRIQHSNPECLPRR